MRVSLKVGRFVLSLYRQLGTWDIGLKFGNVPTNSGRVTTLKFKRLKWFTPLTRLYTRFHPSVPFLLL